MNPSIWPDNPLAWDFSLGYPLNIACKKNQSHPKCQKVWLSAAKNTPWCFWVYQFLSINLPSEEAPKKFLPVERILFWWSRWRLLVGKSLPRSVAVKDIGGLVPEHLLFWPKGILLIFLLMVNQPWGMVSQRGIVYAKSWGGCFYCPIQADKHYKSNKLGCSDFSQIIVRDIGGGWW